MLLKAPGSLPICIYDHGGQSIWHETYQRGAPKPGDCAPDACDALTAPSKRALGNGNFAFDFPLSCANARNCVLTLVVYTLDPPSLTSVGYRTGPLLKCIARQIDVDVTLNTATIDTGNIAPPPPLNQALEEPSPNESMASSMQSIVDLCYAGCVAVVVPANRIMAIACHEGFVEKSISDMVVRLHEPLQKKRRVIVARITLLDGRKCHVVCAPIGRK